MAARRGHRLRSSRAVCGASHVARIAFSQPGATLHPVLVNGSAGVVVVLDGEVFSILGFTVAGGKIVEIDALADPERIAASRPQRAGRTLSRTRRATL